jgi:hypothetical protein
LLIELVAPGPDEDDVALGERPRQPLADVVDALSASPSARSVASITIPGAGNHSSGQRVEVGARRPAIVEL